MARPRSPDPVTKTYGLAVTDDEAARIDAAVREAQRTRRGERITRSSFLRALVLAALRAESVNP